MKKIIFALPLILFACTKETIQTKPGESISLSQSTQIQTDNYLFKYSNGTVLGFKRVTALGFSTCTLTEMSGTVKASFTIDNTSGAFSNVYVERNWATCMANTLVYCARIPLCANGVCRGEAIVMCIAEWGIGCLFDKKLPVIVKI